MIQKTPHDDENRQSKIVHFLRKIFGGIDKTRL